MDLSPEALQKRRDIAEKCKNNIIDGKTICLGLSEINANYFAADSPNVVIAMIDEIERLRKENARLGKEADCLADALAEYSVEYEVDASLSSEWREAAKKALEEQCKTKN